MGLIHGEILVELRFLIFFAVRHVGWWNTD